MKLFHKLLSYSFFISISAFSQIENDSIDNIKIEPKLSVLDSIKKTFINHSEVACMDSMWMKELSSNELSDIQFEDILKINPDESVVYDLNTDVLKERLAKLDAKSPFNIEYNVGLENVIKSLLKNRKKSYERLLGISQYYFPLFEEALSKYNIPIEVKYLAIVESALNPKAKSRVGATGLWQFMYNTGLQYKLDVNSYIDERSDPIKATEAACKYLSGMYNIFGDWDLVLASYNCGPGNVTKAIRRSNGQTNYWNIRKNLPRETAGYLPAFLATMYIMEYHNEHGISKPKPLVNYFSTDTIVVKHQLSFNQISKLIDIPEAELQFLNPSYKLNVIPVTNDRVNYLRLPQDKIAVFTSNEDKIYYFANYEANLREKPNKEPVFVKDSLSYYTNERKFVTKFRNYKVKRGDNLGEIASKFGVTVSEIKSWNRLKSNNAPRGKNLKIETTESVVVKVKHSVKPENILVKNLTPVVNDSVVKPEKPKDEAILVAKNQEPIKTEIAKASPEKEIIKYEKVISYKDVTKSYKVKKGDNLSEIADKFNVAASDIKKWNKLKGNSVAKGKTLKIITNEKVVTTIKKKEFVKQPENVVVNNQKTTISVKEVAEFKSENSNKNQSETLIYKVKKGDNINDVAAQLEVSVKDLKTWNNLKNNNISGKKLKYSIAQNNTDTSKNNKSETIIASENKDSKSEHVVVKGDNLNTISRKYKVTIDDLKKWNYLDNNNISLGTKLIIANPKIESSIYYTVVKGDNIWKVAEKHNTTAKQIKDWNHLQTSELIVGKSIIVSEMNDELIIKMNSDSSKNRVLKANEKTYLVRKGDSLFSISQKYPGVTVADLKKWNDIKNGDIKPGMKLKIII